MTTPKRLIEQYYEYANAGKWMAWCDLFADDMVMDEQLAGHIVGLSTLRPMMAGMGQAYAVFQNVPSAVIVEGDQGAVLSHISARAAKYPDEPIEANVMNYFTCAMCTTRSRLHHFSSRFQEPDRSFHEYI